MSEIYCKKCGNIAQPKDRFCRNCGSPLDTKTVVAENTQHAKPKQKMNILHNLFGKKQKDQSTSESKNIPASTVAPPSVPPPTATSQTTDTDDVWDKSSVNEKINDSGWTRLHQAAISGGGDVELAKRLISQGANVNFPDKHGDTPLCFAAMAGNLEICKLLIENGAKVEQRPVEDGWPTYLRPPLLHAADVECKSADKELKLKSVAEYLLSMGADPNAARQPNREFALHRAAWWGSFEIVKVLVINGANVNARDWGKETPLTLALRKANWTDQTPAQKRSFQSIAKYLKKHGGTE